MNLLLRNKADGAVGKLFTTEHTESTEAMGFRLLKSLWPFESDFLCELRALRGAIRKISHSLDERKIKNYCVAPTLVARDAADYFPK
jgi:hypothetical protein